MVFNNRRSGSNAEGENEDGHSGPERSNYGRVKFWVKEFLDWLEMFCQFLRLMKNDWVEGARNITDPLMDVAGDLYSLWFNVVAHVDICVPWPQAAVAVVAAALVALWCWWQQRRAG
ncbi:hypothetical protein [Rhodococcoides kroppenstedtii]|uniref:hypothetical protein n=1 Tax=Rhodococcoides kroppenstedtii TaxID=293050 RepID=UPI00364485E4